LSLKPIIFGKKPRNMPTKKEFIFIFL